MSISPYIHMSTWTFRHMDIIQKDNKVVMAGEFFLMICFICLIPFVGIRFVFLYVLLLYVLS
jgi:uncharacterized membrane protein